jgi:hypothetical protein
VLPSYYSIGHSMPISQADVLAAALDPEVPNHIFTGVPTGGGKSLPQILVSLLAPAGT